MKNIPLIVYIIIGAANVLGHLLEVPDMVKFSKPMLMPALIYYVYSHAKGNVPLKTMLLVVALVFSWLGDMALMQDAEMYFMLGLGAFLIAQITYTYTFLKSTFERPEFRLMPLLPILTFTIFLLAYLLPALPSGLQIPVAVYALCLTMMACMARLRAGITSENSYQWAMMGALLFVVSDSAIAIDKFYRPIPYDSVVIMSTYIVAQLLIVRGVLAHPD
jgi:uncharacterized membrane protein YhhN